MNTHAVHPERSYRCWLVGGIILCLVFGPPSASSARRSSATVSDVEGHVKLYGRSVSPVIGRPVKIGEVLQAGDSIQTEEGAKVSLTFIEGSLIELEENTRINLAMLEEASSGARESELFLHTGRVRATLSAGHQKKGSSFRVKTPNVVADVEFSRPVIEVSYDPTQNKTTIDAYTVDVNIRNLLTGRSMKILSGHQGIIQKRKLSMSPISVPPGISVPEKLPGTLPEELSGMLPEELPKPTHSSIDALQQTWNDVRQAAGVSNFFTAAPETSSPPGSGVRPGSSERQPRTIIIHLREE